MKNRKSLFLMILLPLAAFGQVSENFSDGNFNQNPEWTGITANFQINAAGQLQSKATTASSSWLFTPSQALENASWECMVKITYPTSSSNYACIYLSSDRSDASAGFSGYYVQIGGTNDEVSLYVQEGTKKTKIIDGTDKRTDGNTVELKIKVTHDNDGNFALYSKLPSETEYYNEGNIQDKHIQKSTYFGLGFSNTSTTGLHYYFDDIVVTGERVVDREPPRWLDCKIQLPDKLVLYFSEPMNLSNANFTLSPDSVRAVSCIESNDRTSAELTFDSDFERGRLYRLMLIGAKDTAGNCLSDESRTIGLFEPALPGDIVINEIMFENPEKSLEYIELINRSEKLLDISGYYISTRKSDGSLSTGIKIPANAFLETGAYMAFTENADSVRKYHNSTTSADIRSATWSSLNNEKATVAISNALRDTVFDEVSYSVKWHHPMVRNPKGVALERIHPGMLSNDPDSWHSAGFEHNYGTPGERNSQYREITQETLSEKIVKVVPEAFSPDNDGRDDICLIQYRLPDNGYVASVSILSPTGTNINQLVSNELLAAEGYISWDGRNSRGTLVSAGVYVLYFEMFQPEKGLRKQVKLPVVVSFR